MNRPRRRLSQTDIAMIEMMKLDDGYEQYHEDVDLSVPFEVREYYDAEPARFLPRLLAERATLYCRKKLDIPVDKIQAKWMRWVVMLSIFTVGSFLFFAIVTALGVPAIFFSGEKREASVLAVSVLIGVMTLPCLIPAISLVSLILQRVARRTQATIADVILLMIGTTQDGWASLRGRPLPSQQPTPNRFATVFGRNSYFAAASTIFLSNLYFVLMGVAIWGVLWLFLFSRNVNYVHESSLSTPEERTSFIESVGKPVTLITGTPVPVPAAMRWAGGTFAFDEQTFVHEKDGKTQPWSEAEIERHRQRTIDDFRRDWSRFLLSAVWSWVFLPRVAVAVVACACMIWFRGDFLPTHSDPANRQIVDHIQNRRSQVDEIAVAQVDDGAPNPSLIKQSRSESATAKPTSPPAVVKQSAAAPVRPANDGLSAQVADGPLQAGLQTVGIAGFGLGSRAADSTARLAKLGNSVEDFGNLNGAKQQLRFRSRWRSDEFADTSLIVLASLTSVPTVSFGEFLSALVESNRDRAAANQTTIRVVLTDGIETRERLAGNPDVFQTRVNHWTGRIVEAGVEKPDIFEFDVSNDAGADAAWCALKLESNSVPTDGLKVAGKANKAVDLIRHHFRDALATETEIVHVNWTQQLISISDEVGKLYQEQQRCLLQSLDRQACSDAVKTAINSCELPGGIVPQEFEALAKATALFKTVSPQWMGAGALGGLGLGVATGIASLATGGVAAISVVIPALVTSTFGGAIAAQVTKTLGFSDRSFSRMSFAKSKSYDSVKTEYSRADTLPDEAAQTLRACILQVIVWELQGNPEGDITRQIHEQTQRLDHYPITNQDDIETILRDFTSGMSTIGGKL